MNNFWTNNPDVMMRWANALRQIVKEMEARTMAGEWSEGVFLATPILLGLSVEIALKAWQRKERAAPPDRGHDLLKLFRALSEDTKKRISVRMLAAAAPAVSPVAPSGIETALLQNRTLFVDWRYTYEHTDLSVETGILSMALDAIVDAYRSVETWKGFIGE